MKGVFSKIFSVNICVHVPHDKSCAVSRTKNISSPSLVFFQHRQNNMHVAISMLAKMREVDLGEGVTIFIHPSITLFEHTGSLRIMARNAT